MFKSHLKRLDSIHKRALKVIGSIDDYLSLGSLYRLSYSVFVFGFFSRSLPSPFRYLFRLTSEQHDQNTGSPFDIQVRRTPTVRSNFSSDVTRAIEWDMLPQKLKCKSSLGSFKNNLKNYLVKGQIIKS